MKNRQKYFLVLIILIFMLSLSACSYFRVPSHNLIFYAEDGVTVLLEGDFRNANMVSITTLENKIEQKKGYELLGFFDKSGNKFTKDLKLSGDMNFTAKVVPITYKIAYKSIIALEGINPSSYTIESDSFTLTSPNSTGQYEFVGWTSENSGKPQKNITINKGTVGDLEFTANWQDTSKYYLYFETYGGSNLEPLESSNHNFDISNITAERLGYEFSGWFSDERFLIPVTSEYLASSKTSVIYAKWVPITYNVTFKECNFGSIVYTIESDDIVLKSPYRAGYEFLGFISATDSTPKKDIIIPKGSHENYEFTAVWEVKTITITFDTQGGSQIAPIVAKYGEKLLEPQAPTKADCEFIGWYLDPLCKNKFDFSKNQTMPSEDLTLYAGWYSSNNYVLSYSSTLNGVEVEASRVSGSQVTVGETVSLSVPTIAYGGIFKNWSIAYGYQKQNYSYDSQITYEMQASNVTFTANYEPIEAFTYTIGELGVNITNKTLNKVFGNGITQNDYSSQFISGEYLSKLSEGIYIFSYQDTAWKSCMVKVVGEELLSEVALDYDLNYPSVTLMFDEADGKQYEYSLNSSAYQDCNSGLILSNYDKGRRNEVTVRNKNDHNDKVSLIKASNQMNKSYYERTFSFSGATYDYVLESKEEVIEFAKYFAFVGAFESQNQSPSLVYPCGTASINAYIADSFKAEFVANEESYCEYVFNNLGVPYFPYYSYELNDQTNIFTYNIFFMNDSPNKVQVATNKNLPINSKALLVDYSLGNANYKLPYEKFEKTQLIRTVYELENLAYGVKPIFDEHTEPIAKEVFTAAEAALKKYTNAQMNNFEVVTVIYDYLASTITYETEVVSKSGDSDIGKYSAFTSYGALVKGFAVCDGISSAFNIMCNLMGIESYEVTGYSTAGGIGGHAWNKVNVYGTWYGVDLTWAYSNIADEQGTKKYITHRFLFIDEGELYSSGHIENGKLSSDGTSVIDGVVEIAATASVSYYELDLLSGLNYTATSGDKLEKIIAEVAKRGGTCVEVYFKGGAQSLNTMMNYVNRITGKYKISGTSLLFTEANGSKVYMIYFN